jgi:hypothetical protein
MTRRLFYLFLGAALVVAALVAGCAGPNKLAEKSQRELAEGDVWKAWQLATRALDREPMNPRAREAATATAQVISTDWQRRIHALATVDSLRAAEQVLAFAEFRANAVNYTSVGVPESWTLEERTLRNAAARHYYGEAREALAAHRPKAACAQFHETERYVQGYRDVARLSASAYEKALTRVAVLPFSSGEPGFGREVSERWRDALAQELAPPAAQFTRILGADAVTSRMSVAQLGRLSREEAVKLGRKSGAQRIVWGSLGAVKSETGLHFFRDRIARRIVQKGEDGKDVTRWIEVPIEVIARVRDVTVDVDFEVISTADGLSLAHERAPRTARARAVWTSYMPEGDLTHYALVSETVRSANPDRVKDVETRWKAAVGEATLQQVLSARRDSRGEAGYDRSVLPRIVAGAAFVFLQELPPAQELALAAVSGGWQPVHRELARLDRMDDVDLGVALGDD